MQSDEVVWQVRGEPSIVFFFRLGVFHTRNLVTRPSSHRAVADPPLVCFVPPNRSSTKATAVTR
jgi:hypothetical protein